MNRACDELDRIMEGRNNKLIFIFISIMTPFMVAVWKWF